MTSRDCLEIRELLDSYAAGELLVETNHQLLRHLRSCPSCRAELAARDALREALRRIEVPARAPKRLVAAIQTEVDVGRRPRLAVALATCLFSIATILAWQLLREQPLSAAVLLEQATSREHEALLAPDVVRRVFLLEERLLPMRELVGRRRVEVWSDGRRGLVARRAYDDANRLLAGEWRGPDGGRIYRRDAPPTEQASLVSAEAVVSSGESWRLDLSVATVAALEPRRGSGRVLKASRFLMLEFEWPAMARGVSRVQLFLRPDDLHPIEQRLTIQFPGSVREVRLLETERTRIEAADVADQIFTPDPELVPSEPRLAPRVVARRPKPPIAVKPVASLDTEIALLYSLHRLDLLADGRATVIRRSSGVLELQAEAVVVEAAVLAPLTRQYSASVVAPDIVIRAAGPPLIRQGTSQSLLDTHDRLSRRISILVDLLDRMPPDGASVSLDMAAAYQTMVRDLARAIGGDAKSGRLAIPGSAEIVEPLLENVVTVHAIAHARAAVRRLQALATSAREAPDHLVGRFLLALERQASEFDNPWPLEGEDRS